jgi:hypothetical protein
LRVICRNCHQRFANRPRRLCWTCYYTPGVKDRFPALICPKHTPAAPRVVGCPTEALPGTPEKVAVMAGRYDRGEALFHPRDAKQGGE